MDIEKKLALSEYNRVYGGLLTEHQHEMLSLYFDCDVSLNELSEQFNVSRQAIRDALVRGEKALLDYEIALKLVEYKKVMTSGVEKALAGIKNGNIGEAVVTLTKLLSEEDRYGV